LRSGPAEPWRECAAAVIPSDLPHESDVALEEIATVWVEPPSAIPAPGGQRVDAIRPLPEQLAAGALAHLTRLHASMPDEDRSALLDDAVAVLTGARRPPPPMDTRVERALVQIDALLPLRLSATGIAAHVDLSVSRFEHLFTTSVGISFRPYVLWARLKRAVGELSAGASLTDAAHSAGFADQAHLSRTFRRMLGFTPSAAVSRFVQDGGQTTPYGRGHG